MQSDSWNERYALIQAMTSHLGFDGVCAIGVAFSVAELSGMATLLFGAAFGTSLCMGVGGGVTASAGDGGGVVYVTALVSGIGFSGATCQSSPNSTLMKTTFRTETKAIGLDITTPRSART